MKKTISLCLVLICIIVMLCGCGTNEIQQQTQEPADVSSNDITGPVDLTVLRESVIDQLEISDPLTLESSVLVDLYGIGEDLIAQSGCFVTMSGTFPDEVLLIEAIDPTAATVIAEKLQGRLDEVLVQSKTYDAENYAAAQNCKVTQCGSYVTLILSPKQAEIAEICQVIMK